jgi:hypothetical protein
LLEPLRVMDFLVSCLATAIEFVWAARGTGGAHPRSIAAERSATCGRWQKKPLPHS